MYSKFIGLILVISFSGPCFADERAIDVIETSLAQNNGDVCTGEEYSSNDFAMFEKMFESLKVSVESGTSSTIEMVEEGLIHTTLYDSATDEECTLYNDIDDSNCNYANCF